MYEKRRGSWSQSLSGFVGFFCSAAGKPVDNKLHSRFRADQSLPGQIYPLRQAGATASHLPIRPSLPTSADRPPPGHTKGGALVHLSKTFLVPADEDHVLRQRLPAANPLDLTTTALAQKIKADHVPALHHPGRWATPVAAQAPLQGGTPGTTRPHAPADESPSFARRISPPGARSSDRSAPEPVTRYA